MTEDKNKANSFWNYIISFFIYSIILWVYNVAENWVMFPSGSYDLGMVLFGPYAPYAALELMGIMGLFVLLAKLGKKRQINLTLISLIVMSIIGFAFFEYFGSWAYETIFGKLPWDYGERIMNINGRVCCEHIIALTVIEVAGVYVIQPFINKCFNKLNVWIRALLSLALVAAFAVYIVYIIK